MGVLHERIQPVIQILKENAELENDVAAVEEVVETNQGVVKDVGAEVRTLLVKVGTHYNNEATAGDLLSSSSGVEKSTMGSGKVRGSVGERNVNNIFPTISLAPLTIIELHRNV